MANKATESFFITLHLKKGETIAYSIETDATKVTEPFTRTPAIEATYSQSATPSDFQEVFRNFVTIMESYRRFIPMTISIAHLLSVSIVQNRIGGFAREKGKTRGDLSNEDRSVYEVDWSCYREFSMIREEVYSALKGTKNLPEVLLIGLISSYDAFLASLLRVVLFKQENIFFTSAKSITFAELSKLGSIDDAKRSLIDKEIEGVIRSGHDDQFAWMEKQLALPLRAGLKVWPRFIEVCERRNLLTHTGGIVSAQYSVNCTEHKADIKSVKVGDKLSVSAPYFAQSVETVYEVGIKLCYVLWRKFAKDEADTADSRINELGYDLIHGRSYQLAEAILQFGVNGFKGRKKEETLSMMTINVANAIRLQGRIAEANKILDTKDWSGSKTELRLGVAAVKGDIDAVIQLMAEIGNTGDNAEHYRSWPVFRGLRENQKFLAAFENVFGEPLNVLNSTAVTVNADPDEPPDPKSTSLSKTKH